MKLCSVCLKNDYLCGGCGKKLAKGEITKTDVDVSRALFKLGVDSDFLRSVDTDTLYILADRAQAGALIGRAGKNIKRLAIMLGRNVRIIESCDDEKALIERVLGVQVLGINKVYNKRELYKVRLERKARFRVNDTAAVEKIINKNVQLVFE